MKSVSIKLFYAFLCLSLMLALAAVQPAYASGTIIVNTNADELNVNGSCSLREAITNANGNNQSGSADCTAGNGTDTITFAGNYTITLGSALPNVSSVIIINGNGTANTIIQANATTNTATYGITSIASGGNLTVNNLTVQNACNTSTNCRAFNVLSSGTLVVTNSLITGNSTSFNGGAISNGGTVTITNSTFSSNTSVNAGAAIINNAVMTVTNSTFSNNISSFNGGGIVNNSIGGTTLTVTNSTFSNNQATNGAGIANFAAATITNSSFSNNTASNGGGGVLTTTGTATITNSTFSGNVASNGGGVDVGSGTATISNSSFSGNSASNVGGGIGNFGGTATVINSTFSGNSGTIHGGGVGNSTGTLTLKNTILTANNTGGNCYQSTAITDGGHNIDSGTTCTLSGTGSVSSTDPLISVLADNGGPVKTFALQSGSPAIDAGDATVCADVATVNNLDARGVTRPQGAVCDIGAFERDTTVPTVTAFSAGATSPTFNIPITAFTASDTGVVGGYMITTSASVPLVGDAGWTSSAPTVYTVGGNGSYSLYPWAKDLSGNISATYGSPVAVNVTDAPPTVVSSNHVDASPTTASSVNYTVTFSEAVTGVDTSDFTVTMAGGVTGASVTSVTPVSSTVYTVAVNTGAHDGTIRLDVVSSPSIQDAESHTLTGPYTGGQTYTVDKIPTVVSSVRANPSPTFNASVDFTVTFSEDVTGVDAADFTTTHTGTITGDSVTTVTPVSASVYTVTVNTGTGGNIGTVRLDVVSSPSIQDGSAQALVGPYTSGESYSIDRKPTIASMTFGDANPSPNTIVGFNIVFSESVTGVDAADFAITSTTTGASIWSVSGFGTNWAVNVDTGTGDGTLRLDVVNSPTIQESASTQFMVGPYTSGPTYTIDKFPAITSIARADANPTTSTSVHFTVTFSETVTGVDTADFSLTSDLTGSSITAVTPVSGAVYTVTVSTGTGTGNLRLDLVNSPSIQDSTPNLVTGPYIGEAYVVNSADNIAPTVIAVTRVNASPTNLASVDYTVTFSEDVTGVDSTDFAITPVTVTGAAVTTVTPVSASVYTVTINTGSGNGTLRLDVNSSGTGIMDIASNPLSGGFTSGETYTVNKNGAPTDISLSNSSIAENKPANTLVGTLSTTDPDSGDTFSYSFCGGTDDASFTISSAQLLNKAVFDADTKASYSICIRSTDSSNLSFDKAFSIAVSQLADKQSALNGGFETYKSTSKIPTSWKAVKFGTTDGKNTTHKAGKFSVQITGNGATKTLSQTITASGALGDPLNFSFYVKGSAVPKAGTCQATVTFFNGSTKVGTAKIFKCPSKSLTFNWMQVKSASFTAPGTFTKVTITFTVKKSAGMLWFDGASLMK